MTEPSPPATPLVSDAPLLQAQAIAALRALDPAHGDGFLLRVLGAYRNSLDRYLEDIAQGRDGADVRRVKLAAHSLKSSSHHVGAVGFADLCAALERQVGQAELADPATEALLQQVLSEAPRVRAAIDEAIARPPAP